MEKWNGAIVCSFSRCWLVFRWFLCMLQGSCRQQISYVFLRKVNKIFHLCSGMQSRVLTMNKSES